MSASSFAGDIISALESEIGKDGADFTSSTPSDANKIIAEVITDYILANTSIVIAYVGVIQSVPTAPDPIVADVIEVEGECDPVTVPSDITNYTFSDWFGDLASNIVSGFKVSDGTSIQPSSTQPAPWISASTITGQIKFSTDPDGDNDMRDAYNTEMEKDSPNPQLAVWTVICQGIIDGLNAQAGGITYSAKNSTANSIGTATTAATTIT